MLIIFILVLIPSIFHVTTSLALNKNNTTNSNNNNNSLTLININNSKQHDLTPSPSSSLSLLSVSDGGITRTPILQDAKSKLIVNKNEKLKTPAPTSNRYRRNVNELMGKSTYDPSYYNVMLDDESNVSPQIVGQLNKNGMSSINWKQAMLSRNRRGLINGSPLSEEFSGMQIWNSVNLSGRRERPFFVEEPPYILVRREAEYPDLIETGVQNELFIPPRGRKADLIEKKSSLNNLFNQKNSDLFMPNRGKKFNVADLYKRAKYNDFVLGEDLFFPNRGKKAFGRLKLSAPTSSIAQALGTDDFFYPNRGKKTHLGNILKPNDLFYPNRGKKNRAATYIGGGGGDLSDLDLFVPNRGKRNLLINKREILLNDKKHGNKSTTTTATPTHNIINNSNNNNDNNNNKGDRYKRDLLDNLSKEKDTFYSARGRRNNNKNSNNNNGETNNNDNNNNNNNVNEKFMDENNKNFLDDKFYTSNEILKKSGIKNLKNDYGIVDDSRVKSFYFIKQIPTMYGMAGADETPKTQHDQQQFIKQQHQQQQEPILSLINPDIIMNGNRDTTMDSSNDINRYTLPRYFEYTDNNNELSNYRK